MSRVVLTLPILMMLMSSVLAEQAGAQDPVFRYASDPFSASSSDESDDTASDESVAGDADRGNEAADTSSPKDSGEYGSYESWPSGSKSAVQEKAVFRAKQREMRIAARKWYGLSASRPSILGNPHYGNYVARPYSSWGSNTTSWSNNWGNNYSSWYYPRRSYSPSRWMIVPSDRYFAYSR